MIAITGHRGFIGSRLITNINTKALCLVDREDSEIFAALFGLLSIYKPESIYHLATEYTQDHSLLQLESMMESNYLFGVRLLEWCRNNNKCKFIYTTSYFADDPKSLYALQKRHIEETAKLYHDLYGVKVAIVKVFNTWSLDDTRDLFLSRVVRGEVKESDLTEPEGIVKFSHVDEVVKCLADLADKDFDYIKIDVPYKEMKAKDLLKVDWSKQDMA